MATHRKSFYANYDQLKKEWVVRSLTSKKILFSFATEKEASNFKKRLEIFPMKLK
jgi:hypothetical protein|tara:strand:- start:518 stop:682 length:165 start_codon:yes stop_codon:yes gene_type:complete